MREFCRYRLQYREDDDDGTKYLFMSRRLLQQLAVDMYDTIEMNDLNWHRHNQKKLRADLYQGTLLCRNVRSVYSFDSLSCFIGLQDLLHWLIHTQQDRRKDRTPGIARQACPMDGSSMIAGRIRIVCPVGQR
jgi:hypothetical protein